MTHFPCHMPRLRLARIFGGACQGWQSHTCMLELTWQTIQSLATQIQPIQSQIQIQTLVSHRQQHAVPHHLCRLPVISITWSKLPGIVNVVSREPACTDALVALRLSFPRLTCYLASSTRRPSRIFFLPASRAHQTSTSRRVIRGRLHENLSPWLPGNCNKRWRNVLRG